MTEKELAQHIANSSVARRIVDEMGGITIDGATLSEKYAEKMYSSCPNDILEIDKKIMAIRHWVTCVGYGDNGELEVVMSGYIRNC